MARRRERSCSLLGYHGSFVRAGIGRVLGLPQSSAPGWGAFSGSDGQGWVICHRRFHKVPSFAIFDQATISRLWADRNGIVTRNEIRRQNVPNILGKHVGDEEINLVGRIP